MKKGAQNGPGEAKLAPRGAQEGIKKHQSDERGDVQKTPKKHMVFEQFWELGGVVLQPLGAFLGPKMQPGGDKKRNQKRYPKMNKKIVRNGRQKWPRTK